MNRNSSLPRFPYRLWEARGDAGHLKERIGQVASAPVLRLKPIGEERGSAVVEERPAWRQRLVKGKGGSQASNGQACSRLSWR
jgi:hypothetical protein